MDRQKDMAVQLIADQRIEVGSAVGATFDLPLDDPEALAAFRDQDPMRIQRVIELADEATGMKTHGDA